MSIDIPSSQPLLTSLIAVSPAQTRHVASEAVLQRLRYTQGRTITETALETEQAWAERRLGVSGRRLSAGVVEGLQIGVPDQSIEAGRFVLSPGRGIAPGGQDLVVHRARSLLLDDLVQLGTAADAAGAPQGLLVLALQPGVVETERLPVDASATHAFEDPCPRDAMTAPYLDFVLQDAARIGWLPMDPALMGADPLLAPNIAAEAIRTIEASDPASLPWAAFGVPLVLMFVDPAGRIQWHHQAAVVRRGGMLPQARLTRLAAIRQSRIEGLVEETTAATRRSGWDGTGGYAFLRFLPPAGVLPRKSWDSGDFFPSTWGQAQAPIPISQLDALLEASAAMAPYDTSRPRDRVKWLVPVPDRLYAPDLLEPLTTPDFAPVLTPLQGRVADTLLLRNAHRDQALLVQGAIDAGAVTDFSSVADDPVAGETAFPTVDPQAPADFDGKAESKLQAVHASLSGTLFTASQRDMLDPTRLDQTLVNSGVAFGLTPFVVEMRRVLDTANDTIDLAFNRVQAEIYRLRQVTLDNEEATKLATFPVLAGLAKGSNNFALSEGLKSHFQAKKAAEAVVAQPITISAAVDAPPFVAARFEPDIVPITPVVSINQSKAMAVSIAADAEASFLKTQALTPSAYEVKKALTGFGDNAASLSFGSLYKDKGLIGTSNTTLVKDLVDNTRAELVDDVVLTEAAAKKTGILHAAALPGDIRDVRTLTIADRLKTSAALNAKASAVRIKADVLRQIQGLDISLVGLAVPLASSKDLALVLKEDMDRAVAEISFTPDEVKVVEGLRRQVDPDGDTRSWELVKLPVAQPRPPDGNGSTVGVTNLSKLATSLRRLSAPVDFHLLPALTLAKTLDPDPVAENFSNNEGDDESAYLNAAVTTLETVLSILRVVEARIGAISAVVDKVAAELIHLDDIQGRWQDALEVADQDLDEARHDLRVALSLVDEEMRRLQEQQAYREKVLAEEVRFVAYVRPRALTAHASGDTLGLRLPGAFEDPLPDSLREDVELPEDLADMLDAVREMPIGWFASNPELAAKFTSPKYIDWLYAGVKARAQTKYATYQAMSGYGSVVSMHQSPAAKASHKIASGYRGMVMGFLGARAALDVSALNRASWVDRRRRALADLSLNDLIESGTQPKVTKLAIQEVEHIERVIHAQTQLFRQVQPSIRLLWAQQLSAFDTVTSLRSLIGLPGWEHLDWALRKKLIRLNDWLFSRMEKGVEEADAIMTDVVRVAILLASYAPVADIIAARIEEDQTVQKGGAVDLVIKRGAPKIGMQVAVFAANAVQARGVVRDLSGAKAKVEITYLAHALTTVATTHQVAVYAPGARTKIGV